MRCGLSIKKVKIFIWVVGTLGGHFDQSYCQPSWMAAITKLGTMALPLNIFSVMLDGTMAVMALKHSRQS